jgi:hypothetical protein
MAKGVKAALKYANDRIVLSPRKAIIVHCAECMGLYEDGPQDCHGGSCSLYPYMPYNKNKIKFERKGNSDNLKKFRDTKEEDSQEHKQI